ncbi:MAG: phosphoesterase PA-phosphatase [Clostridia bacterium]|nr:phosphoesterase PA-phosphatase [Clostridia bacterium]
MKKRNQRIGVAPPILLAAFVLWTVLVRLVDVQPIGPQETAVGFATLNGYVHELTGVHMILYVITDWLGLVPLGVALGFAALGLAQWIGRGRIARVDRSILALGGFYVAVMAAYVLFEKIVINYRPVLIDGCLEASYPSSTTLLVMCVMPTAMMQWHVRIRGKALRRCVLLVSAVFIAFTVIGRWISGVHWFTDIIGGALLSAGLVMLYAKTGGVEYEKI